MEKKVCTYTDNTERLQLVRIVDDNSGNILSYELRANRVLIERFAPDQGLYARLYWYHAVHEIVLNRSTTMIKMT